jgi:hypothetical protein
MTEIQQMQNQLTEAFGRIRHLEEEINSGKELPRWQYLVARPHRWRRQLCIKRRNLTGGPAGEHHPRQLLHSRTGRRRVGFAAGRHSRSSRLLCGES